MSTYTECYFLKSLKDITKNDIIELCKMLKQEFNNEIDFFPEKISEGGIIYKF